MSVKRFYYVTQDALQVWEWRKGKLTERERFAHSDEGFNQFSSFLSSAGSKPALMVVDVIEEEFFPDTIPALGYRDRVSLIERRVQKRFPRTTYRIGQLQGKSASRPGESEVLYSAVSNPELLDSWLKVLETRKAPLVGIYSVPLLSVEFLKRVCKPARHALLLGTHQDDKLRQMFIVDGRLKSSRLSKSPPPDAQDFASQLAEEIQRSRRYLERGRMLSPRDELHIYVIGDVDLAHRIAESHSLSSGTRVHAISPQVAAAKTGLSGDVSPKHIEALYLALATRKRLRANYSVSGETRYNSLRRIRQAAIAATVVIGMVCSGFSGIYLTDALQLRNTTQNVREQIARLEETYRRENEKFQPLKADSQEMKIVVDTGDFIIDNTLPVAFVMQQLGAVLGDFPDMHIDELQWDIGGTDEEEATQNRRRRSETPMPIPIPPLTAVSAEMSGQIVPFDGDMRGAFRRIRELAAALESRPDFSRVQATEFPINDSPSVALSADLARDVEDRPVKFRLRLTLEVANES